MPVPGLSHLHMDPEEPVAGFADGQSLAVLEDETIDAWIGATVGSPLVVGEVRHLGGAVARGKAEHGAVASFAAPYLAFSVGLLAAPELREPLQAAVYGFVEAFAPWAHEHTYLNFAEGRRDAKTLWTESAHRRLRRVKAAYDPENVIRSNHPLA
jgi:hypothetical protein